MPKIVIYRLGSLGDTIVALPFFNRIAQIYPDHERIVLTNVPVSSNAAPLMAILGEGKLVHRAIAYPVSTRDPSKLCGLRDQLGALEADTLIYFMSGRGSVSVYRDAFFFRLSGFKQIIGLPWHRDLNKRRIDPNTGLEEPECERLGRALTMLGPVDLHDPRMWDLQLDEAEIARGRAILADFGQRPYLAINMGGKVAPKDWGEANWRLLLSELAKQYRDFGLLVVGAAVDLSRAVSVTNDWPGPVVDACGALSPRESAAALAGARVFIGHDSGPLHLASVVGVRCVGLFGGYNRPRAWHPYIGDHRIIHKMEGMAAITVEEVAAATLEQLEASEGGKRCTIEEITGNEPVRNCTSNN